MIQVKEFKAIDSNNLDEKINEWIKENYNNITIKDIKYQFTTNKFATKFSTALVIYDVWK